MCDSWACVPPRRSSSACSTYRMWEFNLCSYPIGLASHLASALARTLWPPLFAALGGQVGRGWAFQYKCHLVWEFQLTSDSGQGRTASITHLELALQYPRVVRHAYAALPMRSSLKTLYVVNPLDLACCIEPSGLCML